MKPRPQRKVQSAIQRLPSLREPISRRERTILMLIAVLAVGMRFALAAHISIEHWDEAVYSCNRFFPDGYPARYLYAPPLLPALIDLSMLAAGPTSYAAVLPNLIFSTMTVILCWWAARDWFGRSAGLAAAALAALNDFHIAYSRTALTDPALCFFFLLAVYFTWRALTRHSLREAVVAGVSAGAAWATKYNGWMTLAVALSAFVAWGLFERFSRKQWLSYLKIVGTIVLTALVSWSPVWFSFRPGQYSAVVQNQAGYFVGLAGWWTSFVRQAANLRFFESWASAASLALAFGLPLVFHRSFRLLGFAIILALEAIPVGITALLIGPALIGPGILLFSSYRRELPDNARRARCLATWLLWAWTLGFVVSTPAYTPYPRLTLPWLISALLATAAVCGMIFEPPTVATNAGRNPSKYLRWALIAVWILGPFATLQYHSTARSGLRFLPRDEKGHPQGELVLGNLSIQERAHSKLPVPGWEDRTARGKLILEAVETARQKITETGPRTLHFISYGEPAIVFHLDAHGFDVLPVTDLSFLEPGNPPLPQPTFLIAFLTDELKRLVQPYSNRLKVFGIFREFRGSPSDLVLLDKFPPSDLVRPGGRPAEELRLYRIEAR